MLQGNGKTLAFSGLQQPTVTDQKGQGSGLASNRFRAPNARVIAVAHAENRTRRQRTKSIECASCGGLRLINYASGRVLGADE
jgi:hypothetical protein